MTTVRTFIFHIFTPQWGHVAHRLMYSGRGQGCLLHLLIGGWGRYLSGNVFFSMDDSFIKSPPIMLSYRLFLHVENCYCRGPIASNPSMRSYGRIPFAHPSNAMRLCGP